MTTKFVKGLITPQSASLTPTQGLCAYLKLMYEFWGFCVNGTSDLNNPGGFASTNGTFFPIGFSSGSTTLLASGSDGITDFGTSTFRSSVVDFLSLHASKSLNGKCLVTWKQDSTSTDDSIYRILGVDFTGSLKLDVSNGGTPKFGSKAVFTSRTNINFRIIDLVGAATLGGWTNGNYMVLNVNDAPVINVGQAIPQVWIELTSGTFSQSSIKLSVSPSGSWTGSTFTDTATRLTTQFVDNPLNGSGIYYFIGARDFMISHFVGVDRSWNSSAAPTPGLLYQPGIHFEIPKRLYPQTTDPNPVVYAMWSNSGYVGGVSQTTGSYADSFYMQCQDGIERKWTTMVRAIVPNGDYVHPSINAFSGGIWEGFKSAPANDLGLQHFDKFSKTIMTTDAVLMQTGSSATAQFALTRVKLRTVRFTSPTVPLYARLGGAWLHIGGGVMWPWDDTDKALGLFSEGGGGT